MTAPSAEQWARIEAAFAEAIALPPAQVAGFLASLSRDEPALADEVKSLLGARDKWWLDETMLTTRGDSASSSDAEWIGPYRLVRSLGLGGMGEVWLAVREGEDFRQSVALKIVRSGMESAELLAAFRAERQILGTLNHPNIAHLLDVGETDDGIPYLSLEYVEGVPLTEYCENHRLPLRQRLKLFRSVCDGVRYAHQNLVVHRDLKPSNILVTADGVPKLLDFGIAKVLNPNTDTMGLPIVTPDRILTPDYAAPEQIGGGIVTTASDIYSLGVILFELLVGTRPYRVSGRGLSEMVQAIRDHQPVAPSAARGHAPDALMHDLDAIVLRAMHKDPQQRYSSAEQLGADLDRALDSRPVNARARTARYVAGRFIRRHRLIASVAGVATVVLIGFLMTLVRQASAMRERSVQIERQHQRAQDVASFLRQLFRGGDPAGTRGDTVTAREMLDRGAERVTRELAGQPELQAELMSVISGIYEDLGSYDAAERVYRDAIAMERRWQAPADTLLALSLDHLGRLYLRKGEPARALPLYTEALAIRRARFGAGHPSVRETEEAITGLTKRNE